MALDPKQVESIQFWRQSRPALYAQFVAGAYPGDCPYCQGRFPRNDVRLPDGGVRAALWCLCQCPGLEQHARQSIGMLQRPLPSGRAYTFEALQARDHRDWDQVPAIITHLEALIDRPFDAAWITLLGKPGNGKSHLLSAAYQRLRHLAAYVYVDALADDLRQAISNNAVADLKDAAIDVPVLFLDDLGTEHANSEFITAALNSIVSQRYMAGRARPTLVATNLGAKALRERYGRMADRLLDRELVHAYALTMPSWRMAPDSGRQVAFETLARPGTDEVGL